MNERKVSPTGNGSPVATYGGYAKPVPVAARSIVRHSHVPAHTHGHCDFGGCLCWAF
jgi:hypothetical protein